MILQPGCSYVESESDFSGIRCAGLYRVHVHVCSLVENTKGYKPPWYISSSEIIPLSWCLEAMVTPTYEHGRYSRYWS